MTTQEQPIGLDGICRSQHEPILPVRPGPTIGDGGAHQHDTGDADPAGDAEHDRQAPGTRGQAAEARTDDPRQAETRARLNRFAKALEDSDVSALTTLVANEAV